MTAVGSECGQHMRVKLSQERGRETRVHALNIPAFLLSPSLAGFPLCLSLHEALFCCSLLNVAPFIRGDREEAAEKEQRGMD